MHDSMPASTLLTNDGLYIFHGPNDHAIVIICQNKGKTLWIRDFASCESALDVIDDDDVLAEAPDRSQIENELAQKRSFYIKTYREPKGGFAACYLKQFVQVQKLSE